MSTLSYSMTEPFLRSLVPEWQPHARQSASATEWWYEERMLRKHPVIGARMVQSRVAPDIVHAIEHHHERLDGRGIRRGWARQLPRG